MSWAFWSFIGSTALAVAILASLALRGRTAIPLFAALVLIAGGLGPLAFHSITTWQANKAQAHALAAFQARYNRPEVTLQAVRPASAWLYIYTNSGHRHLAVLLDGQVWLDVPIAGGE